MKFRRSLLAIFMLIGMLVALIPVNMIVYAEETRTITKVPLNYTKDVFTTSADFLTELNPATVANEKFMLSTSNYAMDETKLKAAASKLYTFNTTTNVMTFDGADYQFGPLAGATGTSGAPNAIRGKDVASNTITIDLDDHMYSSIRFIANSFADGNTSQIAATVKVIFADGTAIQNTPISSTGLINFRASPLPTFQAYEKSLGAIGAYRFTNETTYTGFYGYMGAYYITPTPGKIVDKLTITSQTAVVYAVSTIGLTRAETIQNIVDKITALPTPVTLSNSAEVGAIRTLLTSEAILESEVSNSSKLISAEKRLIDLVRPVTNVTLNYAKDAFVQDVNDALFDQGLFSYGQSGPYVAFYETGLKSISGFNATTNSLIFDGLSYKFGPLGDTSKNALRGYDSNPITIELDNKLYNTINFLATNVNTTSAISDATVSIFYVGDTNPVVATNISHIKSFKLYNTPTPPVYQTGEAFVGQMQARNSSVPIGWYPGSLYRYTIEPDPNRVVDKITIKCANAVVFAATTVGVSVSENAYKYSISSIDANNSNLKAGTIISKANIIKLRDGASDAKLCIGVYNQDKKLCYIRIVTLGGSVLGDLTTTDFSPISLEGSQGSTFTIKSFILDSTEKMTPLCKPVTAVGNNIKVLAIGNSFSTDATRYLNQIAAADNVNLKVENLYIGGCSLQTHWSNVSSDLANYALELNGESTSTMISIKQALESDDWDYVTLQQASANSGQESTYYPYIENLAKYIKTIEPNAELLIHQTWAYENGSDNTAFPSYNSDQTTMFNALFSAYNNAAAKVGLVTLADGTEISKGKQPLGIIPSGQAFQNARANAMFYSTFNDGKIPKLNRDGFHASLIHGRYLLGAVWYEAITGRKISTNTYNPGATTAELDILKEAAHSAVIQFGWQVEQ